MDNTENPLVDQINAGLGRLYALKGFKYDDDFKNRCIDNGFDDDEEITDEMGANAEESQLADEDFLEGFCPWIQTGDDDERRDAIFAILKECFQNPSAYQNAADENPLKVTVDDFAVTKQDINKAKSWVEEQAPSIYDGGFSNDGSLMYMLTVGMKMRKHYLQYLVDMFLREKLYHHYKHRGSRGSELLSKYEFAAFQQHNEHIKTLKNIPTNKIPKGVLGTKGQNEESVLEVAVAAVKSYLHRVAPQLLLTQLDRIAYPYRTVAQYIAQTVEFVNHLAVNRQNTCPFQYDSVFVFQRSVSDETDTFSSGQDDSDSENEQNDEEAVRQSKLGDIKESLTTTKLKFQSADWGKPDKRYYRPLKETFDELKNKTKTKKFPQFNRFCSVLDLRNDPEKEEKADDSDNLFVFQPAEKIGSQNVRKIHKNASSLNFFHNSRRSIIPAAASMGDHMKNPPQKLTSLSPGPQITMALPLFFDLQDADKMFIESKEMDRIVQGLIDKLRDDQFRAFLRDNDVQCPYQKEMRSQRGVAAK